MCGAVKVEKSGKKPHNRVCSEEYPVRSGVYPVRSGVKSVRDESRSVRDIFQSVRDGNESVRDFFKSVRDRSKSVRDESKSVRDRVKSVRDILQSICGFFEKLRIVDNNGMFSADTIDTAVTVSKISLKMNRLILLVENRIRGDVYVRFGGEYPKTQSAFARKCRRNMVQSSAPRSSRQSFRPGFAGEGETSIFAMF
jgi:Asp-tRNA(Asn)/Glu-tRNA(Gln) amidotransferase C subunit